MVKKLAVLVGCNYKGAEEELSGSINSVWVWRELLLSRFGFNEPDIMVLTDDGGGVMPKSDKIIEELKNMVAKGGDVFFFQFSGQGKLQPDPHPAIVASDHLLVTDMQLKEVVDLVPKGASFTMLADCSHSGELIYGKPDAGILLSSCKKNDINSNEIDVTVPGRDEGITYGHFADAVKAVLYENPNPITNKHLVTLVRARIPHAGLYCSDDNANAHFLGQPTTT